MRTEKEIRNKLFQVKYNKEHFYFEKDDELKNECKIQLLEWVLEDEVKK